MARTRWRRRGVATAPVLALTLAIGVLLAPPALAHSFTQTDGNDTAGKLDLASVSVGHKAGAIVYTFRTRARWTSRSLGARSFFVVGIDKDGDEDYERCAFIFYDNRLRGSLTNCRDNFIDPLAVSHPSGTVAKVVIPTAAAGLGGAYWWYGASQWFGRAPCRSGCNDFAPNQYPDLLHDLTPPVVTTDSDPLRIWEASTSPDFVFPFVVNDAHTGIASWTVQSRPLETTTWTAVSTGSGEGPHDPSITGVAPGQYQYRVVAIDDQGNRDNGGIRLVYVPTDVDADTGPGISVGGVDTADVIAYGGSYVALNDVADSYAVTFDHTGGPCRRFELIGPGAGRGWCRSPAGREARSPSAPRTSPISIVRRSTAPSSAPTRR